MTKADKLRGLFPDFVGHVDVELNGDGSKRVTFLDVEEDIIAITYSFPESCGCCMSWESEEYSLDCTEDGVNEFDDEEFELLIRSLK